MQEAEIRDGGALLGTTLGEFIELTRDVQKAVAGRVFARLGPRAALTKRYYDAIAATGYAATRLSMRVIPAAAAAVAAHTGRADTESVHDSPRGHFAFSALSGIWGDRLAEQRAALAPTLSMRTHDGPLRRTSADVVNDLGDDPTGKLAVFVHGLCESEHFWWFGAEKNLGDRGVTYGSLLREDLGWTPLYVRYNSGLHVSENGRLMADYIQALISEWPVPVTEMALVGHSMGGLVARSAAHQAAVDNRTWTRTLRHIVGLGAPHLGAPLERWVNAGTHAMAKVPETRPIATWLNRRSAGIKDMRYGALVEDDWAGVDPDDRLDRCTPANLLPGVAYSMVSATVSRNPKGPLAHDLLVEHVSAHGTGRRNATRRIEFDADRLFHVGQRTHFHLLTDSVVYDQLRSWLDGSDGPAAATARLSQASAG